MICCGFGSDYGKIVFDEDSHEICSHAMKHISRLIDHFDYKLRKSAEVVYV